MHEADEKNVTKAALLMLDELGADSTWFAAAWADIYRRMQDIETRRPKKECRDAWHMHHGDRTSCGTCGQSA